MLTGGTLTPAYGRDIRKRADALEQLNEGLDFTMSCTTFQGYCSIRDLADGLYQVRDKSLRKLWTVKVKAHVAA